MVKTSPAIFTDLSQTISPNAITAISEVPPPISMIILPLACIISSPIPIAVQGRDLLSGKPKQVEISHREIAKALDKSILRIEDAIMETLSQTPPELAADIYNTGIYMAGGGSMLRGLDKRISMRTDLPVYVAEDPLRAVVRGTGIALKNIHKFKTILKK